LSLHRLEYINDIGNLVLNPEQADSLIQLRDELTMFRTDDPFVVQMISKIHDSVNEMFLMTRFDFLFIMSLNQMMKFQLLFR
jgi:hypothetical protein